ncbi:MAG: phage holin family protein [Deltaproteobacteria bacterium]|nr:phage holin family protein [Deltaproteobacteria bacterium]
MATQYTEDQGNGRVGELLHRITDDVKTIAHDEIELVKEELAHTAKAAAVDAAVILLAGIVALIGVGMLCVCAVVALAPIIHSLALRLLLMAIVYLVGGGAVAASIGVRMKRDIVPDLKVAAYEAKSTVAGAKEALTESYLHH